MRWVAAATALLACWTAAYVLVFGAIQEQRSQRGLYAALRSDLANGTAPVAQPIAAGRPLATIDVPALGLRRAVIVEGTTSADLRRGPGHRRDTVLPGQAGVSVVLGRALAFGGPFHDLAVLRPGDAVDVASGTGRSTYRVTRVRRPGDPVPAPPAAGAGRLVLVSLSGGGWRDGFVTGHVVYVDADSVGPTSAAGPVASGIAAAERPGARDTSALAVLVLALQLLLVVALGVVWAGWRWGASRSWLVSGPLLLAALWLASATAVPLLPNLL